jgi:hypothetical protein
MDEETARVESVWRERMSENALRQSSFRRAGREFRPHEGDGRLGPSARSTARHPSPRRAGREPPRRH